MIDHVLEAMALHTATHPTHGINCSCKDELTVKAKLHLKANKSQIKEFLLLAERVRNDLYWLEHDIEKGI